MPEHKVVDHKVNLALDSAWQKVDRARALVELMRADMAIAASALEVARQELTEALASGEGREKPKARHA